MASSLSFTFRKAAQRDMPQVTALYLDCFSKWEAQPEVIPGYLSERAANPDYNFIVAEDRPGHVAGFVLTNCSYADTQEIVNVDVMAVDKDFRRAGLGKGLMHMADLVAHNAGARGVTLQVVEYNEPAKNLYLSLGFNFYGPRRVGYYRDAERSAALDMVKILPASAAANDETGHPAVQRPQKHRWFRFG